MRDMGIQLEPISQTLEQYGPWHFGDVRFQRDHRAELEAALLQTATISGLGDKLRSISRASRVGSPNSRPDVQRSIPEGLKTAVTVAEGSLESTPAVSSPPASDSTAAFLLPAAFDPSLRFTRCLPSPEPVVTFPLETASQRRPCLKRRRPDTDVDGPNSATLGCKKRRLLRHLITSRLSQPFSLPATHIPNRESVTTGEKRFVKLAAIMSARRLNSSVTTQSSAPPVPPQPSPSTWLRRAAVLNSLRARVCAAAAERANVPVFELAARAAIFQQGPATPGGRYLIEPAKPPNRGPPHSLTSLPPPSSTVPAQTTPPTSSSVQVHLAMPQPGSTTTCLRIPSPKLRPLRSPELRVTRPLVPLEDIEDLNDVDDDSMAFPTSELESRYYEDDSDEEDEGGGGVYADFSIIFSGDGNGQEGEDGLSGSACYFGVAGEQGVEHFEDYMDDLDGIPWGVAS